MSKDKEDKDDREERKSSRSSRYQHFFLESAHSHDMMESFCNTDSIYHRLNPWNYNEELAELEEQLKVEFWRVINTLLTDRQKEVIKLSSQGKTQMEIAKILNVNQSSITKSLHGNVDYKNGKRAYGGSKKKLQKIIVNDEKIKELLEKINELREEKW